MNIKNIVLFGLMLCFSLPCSLSAEVNVTSAELYAAFAKKGPRSVIAHARKAADYIQKGGDLGVFNIEKSEEWWPNYPFFSTIIVMRCDEERDVTHPIDALREGLTQRNVVRKFRDVDGQATFHILCNKIPGYPKGLWLFQRHYWPETKDPVHMAVLLLPVEDTPYQIQAFYLTEEYTAEELNQMLNESLEE